MALYDFTGSDGDGLPVGLTAQAGSTFEVQNNKLRVTGSSPTGGWVATESVGTDHTVSCVINTENQANFSGAGPIARFVDTNNYFAFWLSSNNQRVTLQVKNSGSFTTLAQVDLSGFTLTTDYKLEIRSQGNYLMAYIDDLLCAIVEDTRFLAATSAGFRVGDVAFSVDDLSIKRTVTRTITFNNFTGANGSLPSGWITTTDGVEINGNVLKPNPAGTAVPTLGNVAYRDFGASDGVIHARLEFNAGIGSFSSGLMIRRVDESNCLVLVANASTGAVSLLPYTAGSFGSVLGTFTLPDFLNTEPVNLTVVLSGNNITVTHGGQERFTATIAQGASATVHGVRFGSNDHTIDDYAFVGDAVADVVAPVITVSGNEYTVIKQGDTLPTFTASTDDLSTIVVGGDTPENSVIGTYIVTYDSTDGSGNVATQVRRVIQVDPVAGTVPPTQNALAFPKLTQTSIPNGAQGQNPSGGFTCTGLDRLSNGNWLVGNDGRTAEGSPTFNSSLVILNSARTAIVAEFDMSDPSILGNYSVQGVAVAGDGTYYAASPNGNKILHIDTDGSKLGEIEATGANSLAFDHQRNGLWWKTASESTLKFYNIKAEMITDSFSVEATIDQINISPDGYLYGTYGGNGEDASIKFYDIANKAEFATVTGLEDWQAAEGVYYDPASKVITGVSDGGFHTVANPPLNLSLTYDAASLVINEDNTAPTQPTITRSNSGTLAAGGTATLTASSTDADGDAITFNWSTTAGTLSASTGSSVVFTAPSGSSPVTATISATASDGSLTSAAGTIDIDVAVEVVIPDTTKPVIVLDPPTLIYNLTVGDTFTLPTATLTDNVDSTISISPVSNNVNTSVATEETPYSVVYSGYQDTSGNIADPVTVTVNVAAAVIVNNPPTVTITAPTTSTAGATVTLTANPLPSIGTFTYSWRVISGGVTLSSTTAQTVTYTAPVSTTTVTIGVVANDGTTNSHEYFWSVNPKQGLLRPILRSTLNSLVG